jgi:hypothetical protein
MNTRTGPAADSIVVLSVRNKPNRRLVLCIQEKQSEVARQTVVRTTHAPRTISVEAVQIEYDKAVPLSARQTNKTQEVKWEDDILVVFLYLSDCELNADASMAASSTVSKGVKSERIHHILPHNALVVGNGALKTVLGPVMSSLRASCVFANSVDTHTDRNLRSAQNNDNY